MAINTQYSDRMLQLRARGFCIRDKFADALRGVITAEEAQDIPASPMPPPRGPSIDAAPALDAAPSPWVALNPSGKLVTARHADEWKKWTAAFIARMEDAGALIQWRDAMQPHMEALEAVDAAAVEHIQGVAQDRLDALAKAVEAA